MSVACKQSIDDYLGRDLAAWTGLPEGCSAADIVSWYPFNEGEGVARLGERQVEYRYRSLSNPAFEHPVFFYLEQDRLSCITTDFWSLSPANCEAALRILGAPPHRLDAFFRNSQIPDADWVYPDRGLALCVNPETRLIVRLHGYPPTTLETYRERYRNIELVREFPKDPSPPS